MKVTIQTILFCILIGNLAWAVLPPPPVVPKMDWSIQQYLKELYDNHNVVEVLTTTPNGNRVSKKGSIVIYNNKLWYNTDGGTTWTQM